MDPAQLPDIDFVPSSEDEFEERVAHVTDAIIREGMSVQEFVSAVRPSTNTAFSFRPQPGQNILISRCNNIIRFIQSQHMTVYDFMVCLLESRELWPHQRSLRGTGTYSCSIIRRIFLGLRNLVHRAGNENHVWRELIQAEKDIQDPHTNILFWWAARARRRPVMHLPDGATQGNYCLVLRI
ncbi:uncharacterized protein MELLADRAFT_102092 [Melampsora larici-populina 98AG31]|uniref:Uncharacterized protein n=1 Tax=Melampsora larici-populina (strain 98AG31 / pathotype 3-4-7) TaxID=747676 RepID=F4R5Z2_MELLP|nr:uncharacterized protein MELLADRAFT_102092 [Melampsora larici-populina 98AG31]EGG12124.1 hypothetical protein MELLADRAFT_102092 [Melampsora larici-populina 98AG31]